MNKSPYIKVNNLSHTIAMAEQDIVIIDEINFTINHGESVAIVGQSGAGKSTLLGLLAGLDLPSSGKIEIDEVDICQLNEDKRADLRARNMSFVFQSFQLLPTYTALENVALPLELLADRKHLVLSKYEKNNMLSNSELKGKSISKIMLKIAANYLDKVGLSHRYHHYPHQLSGGEQQRVALARAFVNQPALLFADEPTGNLDFKTSQAISDMMFSLNEQSETTLILITHELSLAKRCQRIFTLNEGKILESKDDQIDHSIPMTESDKSNYVSKSFN